jgi:translocation and assembly module TamB
MIPAARHSWSASTWVRGLYVSYGLGLFDTVNTLRLRYQWSQRMSMEASSGAEAAADVFFTFERD